MNRGELAEELRASTASHLQEVVSGPPEPVLVSGPPEPPPETDQGFIRILYSLPHQSAAATSTSLKALLMSFPLSINTSECSRPANI